jgi:hypothetical protein
MWTIAFQDKESSIIPRCTGLFENQYDALNFRDKLIINDNNLHSFIQPIYNSEISDHNINEKHYTIVIQKAKSKSLIGLYGLYETVDDTLTQVSKMIQSEGQRLKQFPQFVEDYDTFWVCTINPITNENN